MLIRLIAGEVTFEADNAQDENLEWVVRSFPETKKSAMNSLLEETGIRSGAQGA